MTLVAFVLFVAVIYLLGAGAFVLEHRRRQHQLTLQVLEASRSLEGSLRHRLDEIDAYRHDLAQTLQDLGLETVRAAEEGREDQQRT